MLDLNRNVFFAHVPKAAGSSIEDAHGYRDPRDVLLRHRNARQMMEHVQAEGLEPPERAFIVVRNIYDRLRSSYRHFQATTIRDKGEPRLGYTFERYIQTIVRYFERDRIDIRGPLIFLHEARRRVAADIRHIETLSWWTEGYDGDWRYLRFEHLGLDYARQMASMTKVRSLPKVNVTSETVKRLPTDIDKRSLEIIASIYKDEIQRFDMRVPKQDRKLRIHETEWRGRRHWSVYLG